MEKRKMILIVESGATKTDFCLLSDGKQRNVRTGGVNFATMPADLAGHIFDEALSRLETSGKEISELYLYGAGIVENNISEDVDSIVRLRFPEAETVEYGSDMLAASRAVWGCSPGITAILGTGSNCCLYDGKSVVENVRPCGFILGDHGSGAALGKMFLADFFQRLVPEALACDFTLRYGVGYASAVAEVYRGSRPAGYLASFAPYLLSVARKELSADEESVSYAENLVKENLRHFFRRSVCRYSSSGLGMGVVGGFGFACREMISEMAESEGIEEIKFMQTPMQGLAEYHGKRILYVRK